MSAKQIAAHQAEVMGRPLPNLCPECGGTGWLRQDVPIKDLVSGNRPTRCHVCNQNRREVWLKEHCGLAEAELGQRLDQWQTGHWQGEQAEAYRQQRILAYQVIQKVIQQQTGFITFYGDFGSGKSLALQLIANESRLKLSESYYAPFSSILDHVRSMFSRKQAGDTFWQRLLDIPVLCIDEVTRFNETSWARERLFLLADTRYRRRNSHLTVFATNDDPDLHTGEDIGYLFSRMREGELLELRGDVRQNIDEFEF